ncbi:Glucose-6-phosphate/phosphate translocator 1 [Hibiscus syriacus]|uniref:Glucose-6-phosphate/phosphate translocator 1 n=1 Tax=Hibiscus syriacus TaxID=106335 RepID=A0A6A3B9G4_HIBSY|nr:Glucose-6-phosphate/phosphate translocator 1 [Hibiscus syriacus]
MSFSIKQSGLASCMNATNCGLHKRPPLTICRSSFSPSLNLENSPKRSNLSVSKPLHVSSIESIGKEKKPVFQCKAYEADKSQPIEAAGFEVKSEAAKRLKIGIYFATWWALNVVFNIYNKKVLNAYPYPWLTSTLSLACGSLMMLISWATRIAEAPKTDFEFWKTLFPVAVAHTIGHVAATVSMSKVAVSFTHIIKSGEPAFSVLVSRFLLGETFPPSVYLSLVPIIGGCALAAVTELNFNMTGFMGAMISNLAFLPWRDPRCGQQDGKKALSEIGPQFVWWVAAQSIFYHLYNQVSYMSLDEISPLTFSVGNTMKRISVIVSSIIIFHTPVQPINALGAAIAVLGTFLYSQMLSIHQLSYLNYCRPNHTCSCIVYALCALVQDCHISQQKPEENWVREFRFIICTIEDEKSKHHVEESWFR